MDTLCMSCRSFMAVFFESNENDEKTFDYMVNVSCSRNSKVFDGISKKYFSKVYPMFLPNVISCSFHVDMGYKFKFPKFG